MSTYTKKIIQSSSTVIGIGAIIGLLMGAGWALLGDYKGDWFGIVILGGIVGAIFGLPAVYLFNHRIEF